MNSSNSSVVAEASFLGLRRSVDFIELYNVDIDISFNRLYF